MGQREPAPFSPAERAALSRRGIYADRMTPAGLVAGLARQLWPVRVPQGLKRYGSGGDGGYLLPEDLAGIAACFSPGVAQNASFEADLWRRHRIPSHLADFSVEGPPAGLQARSFTRKFLGPFDAGRYITLDSWVRQSPEFASGADLLLQMDIEGSEYVCLLGASEEVLRRFRIISLEVHDVRAWGQGHFFGIAAAMIRRLTRLFWVVHNHPNNFGGLADFGGRLPSPNVFEITLLRKDRATPGGFCTEFPHPLDRPNNPRLADLVLPAGWRAPGEPAAPVGAHGAAASLG